MPIVDLQRRLREIGRIRIGEQVPTSNGKTRPRKLDRFRFTSRDRSVIEATATLWGGDVTAWEAPDGEQWQVVSNATAIAVVVPPGDMAFSQFYEQWTGGGCQRRCDGRWDTVRDAACDCNPENRECKITTRLSVMLPDVPGLGVWRLETHGYYGAVELAGAVDVCRAVTERGHTIPARLRIESRKVQRFDEKGKPVTLRFAVPVLDIDVTLAALGSIGAPIDGGPASLDPTRSAVPNQWQPVGELPAAPFVSVRDQLAEVDTPKPTKPRANAAEPIKATGIKPRPAGERAGCDICGLPYGAESLLKNPVAGGSKFVHVACLNAADGDTAPDQGALEQESDRGGTADVRRTPAPDVEPAPVALRIVDRKPTPAQRSLMFALAGEVFPIGGDLTASQKEQLRQSFLLDLAADLGTPGLTSRKEIDAELASKLIDALGAVKDGRAAIVDGQLVDGDGVIA